MSEISDWLIINLISIKTGSGYVARKMFLFSNLE